MAQRTEGIYRILSSSSFYNFIQNILGARSSRKRIIREWIRPEKGAKILDVGCGTAAILEHLDEVNYVGIDLSESYIKTANCNYGDKGKFHVGDTSSVQLFEKEKFDLIFAIGLLHHLDDAQVLTLVKDVSALLAPNGRFVTLDGTFVEKQNPIARFMIKRDRGLHVRYPEDLASLAESAFSFVKVNIVNDLLRIPYNHIILECKCSNSSIVST